MIFGGILIEISKAADTVILLFSEHLGAFADVSFAFIALNLIGRVQNILHYT